MKIAGHRFLVAGATGFVGRHVVDALCAAGADVHLLALADRGQPERLAEFTGARIHAVAAPTEDALAIGMRAAAPEVLINLAAAGVALAARTPRAMLEGGPGFLGALLTAATMAPPRRILHAGSWLEYGPTERGRPVDENHPLRPDSAYGGVKAAATLFGHALARQFGLPFTTLRLFHVYGPDEAPTRLTSMLCERLGRGETCRLTGGEQVRDMLYVDDVAAAVLAAAAAETLPEPIYNVCTETGVTVRGFAERIASGLGASPELLRFGDLPYRSDETMWMVGDGSRFQRDTGWRAHYDLDAGIEATLAASRKEITR